MIARAEAEYDMRGLTQLVSALDGALFGQGHDGDLHRALKIESGQLAGDISNGLGPKSKEEAAANVDRQVRGFLTDRPKYSNLDEGQQYSGVADFTWLQAGANFLVGINDEDNLPGASADEALGYYRMGQKTGRRGNAYVEVGTRGKQHIYRLNRTRVSTSAKRGVVRRITDKLGTLRASFAFTAARLVPAKHFPAWITKHFPSQAHGRALFNDAGLNNPTEPFLEFGSTSPGVESNPEVVEVIHNRVERRERILREKLNNILQGYAYDWKNGAVFRRREAGEVEE